MIYEEDMKKTELPRMRGERRGGLIMMDPRCSRKYQMSR
jgi:hypothetical protein